MGMSYEEYSKMMYSLAHGRNNKAIRDLDADNWEIFLTTIYCLIKLYDDRALPLINRAHYKEDEYCSSDNGFYFDISEADIFEWLKQEENDQKLINEIISKKRLYDAILSTSGFSEEETINYIMTHYTELASLLGVYYPCSPQCLNKYLVRFDDITSVELKKIQETIRENPDTLITLIQMLVVDYTDGQIKKYKHGTVIKQGRRRYYYRGESALYSSCKASVYRSNNADDNVARLIARMKIVEFTKLLKKFDIVKDWNYGDVIYDALAQHYGLATDLVDITNDLKTALFFACCKYDDTKKEWLPLAKEDIENANSRKSVYDAGGDSRYGIIMRADSEIYDIQLAGDEILPIGYQPFMRCSNQHGFVLKMKNAKEDLKQNEFIKKFRFRLTPEFCQTVFNMMQQGKNIYPTDGLSDFFDEIKYIKEDQNTFSKAILHEACKIEGIKCTNKVYQTLRDKNILIGKNSAQIYDTRKIRRINSLWNSVCWEELYGFNVNITPVFRQKT